MIAPFPFWCIKGFIKHLIQKRGRGLVVGVIDHRMSFLMWSFPFIIVLSLSIIIWIFINLIFRELPLNFYSLLCSKILMICCSAFVFILNSTRRERFLFSV